MSLTLLLLVARATGTLFIFSGVSKLMARYAFLASLRALPFLPSWSVTLVVTVLPWLEIVIGSVIVIGFLASAAVLIAFALLLTFSLVAIVAVARGLDVPCSCFGAASQAPLSRKTVIRNAFLAVLLLPLPVINHPSPMSMDALLDGSGAQSLPDAALIASFPVCVAVVAVALASAQQSLERISPR